MSRFTTPLWVKKKCQHLITRTLRYRVYCFAEISHGHQEVADLRRHKIPMDVIFDVGANIGQSALKFLAAFPRARIVSFEPIPATFAKLEKNVKGTGVQCQRVALGSQAGSATMFVEGNSLTASLRSGTGHSRDETVEVTTVDLFAAEAGISRIDLLKVDAEGFDMEVLRGADRMLSAGRVGAVICEIGFHPCDERFVLFDEVREFLLPRGFSLFGIYDQQPEWSGEKRICYANALFLNVPAHHGK